MKTINDIIVTKEQLFRSAMVPMFLPKNIKTNMEQPMADDAQKNKRTQEQDATVSLFDVKELYDLAYAEKAKGAEEVDNFKKILAEAVKLDMAYRRQLTKTAVYKDQTKLKNFKSATQGKTTSSKVA